MSFQTVSLGSHVCFSFFKFVCFFLPALAFNFRMKFWLLRFRKTAKQRGGGRLVAEACRERYATVAAWICLIGLRNVLTRNLQHHPIVQNLLRLSRLQFFFTILHKKLQFPDDLVRRDFSLDEFQS